MTVKSYNATLKGVKPGITKGAKNTPGTDVEVTYAGTNQDWTFFIPDFQLTNNPQLCAALQGLMSTPGVEVTVTEQADGKFKNLINVTPGHTGETKQAKGNWSGNKKPYDNTGQVVGMALKVATEMLATTGQPFDLQAVKAKAYEVIALSEQMQAEIKAKKGQTEGSPLVGAQPQAAVSGSPLDQPVQQAGSPLDATQQPQVGATVQPSAVPNNLFG